MKWLCKIIGCNGNVYAETEWQGDLLIQFFKCSRCGERWHFCGFIRGSWLGIEPIKELGEKE